MFTVFAGEPGADGARGPPVERGLGWTLAGLVFAVCLVSAVGHLQDEAMVSFVNGVWIGLAQRLSEGVFYPPIFDGQTVAGTRYYPLSILFNQVFVASTPDPVFGLKLASLLTMAAIVGVLVALLRRTGVATHLALPLAALCLVVSEPSLTALLTPHRGDALPLLLQLSALWLALGERTRSRIGTAGVLCGLAVVAKPTAGWAPLAIGLVLFIRDRRRLPPFIGGFAVMVALGYGAATWLSDGRVWNNVGSFTAHGLELMRLIKSPLTFLVMIESEPALFVLAPFVVMDLVLAVRDRSVHLFELSLLGSLAIACFMLADPVIGSNHFLDFIALCPLVLGVLVLRLRAAGFVYARLAVLIPVALAIVVGLALEARPHFTSVLKGEHPHYARTLTREIIPKDAEILSEDPLVDVYRGRRPLLLEACIYPTLVELYPEAKEHVLRLVESEQLDLVVLLKEPAGGLASGWYRTYQLGAELTEAIAAHYEVAEVLGPYHVLRRRGRVDRDDTSTR